MSLLLVGSSPCVFTEFDLHTHNCYEIILNTEGEGIATIGNQEYPFTPGSIHVVPPNVPHAKRSAKGFRDLYMHTDSMSPMESSAIWQKRSLEPLVLTDDEGRTIEGILNVLLNRSLTQPKVDETDEALLKIVLDLIIRRQRIAPADPIVSAVIRTIAASYNDPEFQVTEALIRTGYSKDYVRRRFLRETGVTPIDYLKRIRIRYAKSLLVRKETLRMPVSEIALRSGFYDAAYFCRSFHKETGMTPSEYIRSFGESASE